MKYLILFLTIACSFSANSQIDTIDFNIEESTLNKRTSKRMVLDRFIKSTPKLSQIDSAFVYNKDTVFVKAYFRGKMVFDCIKLPKQMGIGWIRFYKNNRELKKEYFFNREYYASNGNFTYNPGGETGEITQRIFYKNGLPIRKRTKEVDYNDELGFYHTYSRFKYKKDKVKKVKLRRVIYSMTELEEN